MHPKGWGTLRLRIEQEQISVSQIPKYLRTRQKNSLNGKMLIMEDFIMIFTCFYTIVGRTVFHLEAKDYWY